MSYETKTQTIDFNIIMFIISFLQKIYDLLIITKRNDNWFKMQRYQCEY